MCIKKMYSSHPLNLTRGIDELTAHSLQHLGAKTCGFGPWELGNNTYTPSDVWKHLRAGPSLFSWGIHSSGSYGVLCQPGISYRPSLSACSEAYTCLRRLSPIPGNMMSLSPGHADTTLRHDQELNTPTNHTLTHTHKHSLAHFTKYIKETLVLLTYMLICFTFHLILIAFGWY